MKRVAVVLLLLALPVSCDSGRHPTAPLVPERCYRVINGQVVFFDCDSLPPDPFNEEVDW